MFAHTVRHGTIATARSVLRGCQAYIKKANLNKIKKKRRKDNNTTKEDLNIVYNWVKTDEFSKW